LRTFHKPLPGQTHPDQTRFYQTGSTKAPRRLTMISQNYLERFNRLDDKLVNLRGYL